MSKVRQPKRCKSRGPSGFRCQKTRTHEVRDLDVVHQAGALIWRDAKPFLPTLVQADSDIGRFIERHVGLRLAPWQQEIVTGIHNGQTATLHAVDEWKPQSLDEWWRELAEQEIERTVPKAVEYSSTDLTDIGMDLARTMGREVTDEEAAELGVFFYLRGKVARWVGAVMAGQRVSDDTLFDIGVYVRMAQRIRATGGWPGTLLGPVPGDALNEETSNT